MTIEELRALALEAVTEHDNYQHKSMSVEQMDVKAKAAYEKLSTEQRDKFTRSVKDYGLWDGGTASSAEVMRWRYLAQTNLFFLCKLLGYKDVSKRKYEWFDKKNPTGPAIVCNTHEEICNEFFVRKDPTVDTFKNFAFAYHDKKERLLLVPRGGFKSSIDMADTVQYIICWPEVTILILTGVLDLAKDFVKEIKRFFEVQDDGTPVKYNDGSRFLFQVLFPEHCISREEGKSYEYQTPAVSIQQKECTVFAASIEQNLAGWHVGVMKLDDVVTPVNSQTIDRIKNINKQVSINAAMLHPYGFFDKIGTWYDAFDTYGQDMLYQARCEKEGEPIKKKIYIRPAWWPNLAARIAGKVESEMKATDWELWFPVEGQLTYDFLRGKKMEDADGFAIKYLNDPTQVHRINFPRELLIRRTVTANQVPQQGMIVTAVDTAYSTKSWADYTVLITALIYGGRFYIIDMHRDRIGADALPKIIAAVGNKWKPKRICIEEANGTRWLGKEIFREMDQLGIRIPIEFVPLGQGSKKTAKDWKAKPVLRYLGDDRLVFTNQCVGLEQIYTELSNFGTAAGTHDDIVSALSILVDVFGSYADFEGRQTTASPSFVADQQTKDEYDRIYGGGTFSQVFTQKNWNAMTEANADPTVSPQQAVRQAQASQQSDHDPLADLWG